MRATAPGLPSSSTICASFAPLCDGILSSTHSGVRHCAAVAMDRGGMTGTTVYAPGWTLDDIHWESFDPAKVERGLLAAVKSAALVELNAPDYVTYLQRVFRDSDANTLANIEQWGREEIQHGLALGRWAERADPSFDFKSAFARFRAGYKAPHFATDD